MNGVQPVPARAVQFDAPRRVEPEDQVRADYYALLSALFYRAPDARLLQALVVAAPPEGDGALGRTWSELAAASAVVVPEAVEEEFHNLFVGVGRPEVMLYGSYYLAGFMNEKPLAQLRERLAAMGFARSGETRETEDHLAALCDVMRALILGDLADRPATIAEQKEFFESCLGPWAGRCCDATTENPKANYYSRVAAFARVFFEVEAQAFAMPS
jgi:TorA maturation chaperone TorD